MKKTFPLEVTGKKTARVIDSIKHEVRKYLKRERRKKLPDGVDFWDFDCRVGPDSENAETSHVAVISEAIDKVAQESQSAVYIEIQAKPGRRTPKKADSKSGKTASGKEKPKVSKS